MTQPTTPAREDAAMFEQEPPDGYYEAMFAAQDAALVEAHGVAAFMAYLRYEQEEAAAYEACLVQGFHDDPITRSASLDAEERRPIVRDLRARCAAQGCPLCNRTAGCYSCHQAAGGSVMEQDQAKLPQVQILEERTVNPADPTTLLVLACGHSII